ncbi:MAG: tetratricopeptide repeat protein, partial [Acidobacteria bacterium]|nr:tetratricopeptide repeat protein [Candidatus Polarisedimenticola svalbardensis]
HAMTIQADDSHPAFSNRIKKLKQFRSELNRSVELFSIGTEALQAGNTTDAIEALRLFVATFPNSLSGRVNLGAAYLAQVRSRSGTPANLAEVLPILPDPGVTLRGVVDIVDLQSAEDNFRHALNFHEDNTWAAAGLALVYARQERYEESRRLLADILIREPDNQYVQICLGNIEFLEGRHPSAMAAYSRVLEQRPAWPEATKNLALASEEAGELEKARDLWNKLADHKLFGSEARLHLMAMEEPEP